MRGMWKSGRLAVLSFGEGQATQLAYLRATIVPHESAYPGYGEFVVLDADHINVCKPGSRGDPGYARLAAFLQARAREAATAAAARRAEGEDHMGAAL